MLLQLARSKDTAVTRAFEPLDIPSGTRGLRFLGVIVFDRCLHPYRVEDAGRILATGSGL